MAKQAASMTWNETSSWFVQTFIPTKQSQTIYKHSGVNVKSRQVYCESSYDTLMPPYSCKLFHTHHTYHMSVENMLQKKGFPTTVADKHCEEEERVSTNWWNWEIIVMYQIIT